MRQHNQRQNRKGAALADVSCNQRHGRRAARRHVTEFPTSGTEAPDPARTTAKTSPAKPVSLKSADMHQPGCRLPRHHIVRAMLSRTKQGRHQRSSIGRSLVPARLGSIHANRSAIGSAQYGKQSSSHQSDRKHVNSTTDEPGAARRHSNPRVPQEPQEVSACGPVQEPPGSKPMDGGVHHSSTDHGQREALEKAPRRPKRPETSPRPAPKRKAEHGINRRRQHGRHIKPAAKSKTGTNLRRRARRRAASKKNKNGGLCVKMSSIFTKPEQVLKEKQLSQTDQTASRILDGRHRLDSQKHPPGPRYAYLGKPRREPKPQSAPGPAQRGVAQHRTNALQKWKS